jgi:hypothetical protein
VSEVHDWACIADGTVQQVVRWDGLTAWPPADDYVMVDLVDWPHVGIGWSYNPKATVNKFVDNRPQEDTDGLD